VNASSRNLSTTTGLTVRDAALLARPQSADRHPALVYLARLAPGSRRTMAQALTVIAAMFNRTPETLDWTALGYQHTQAVRAKLAETRAPAGVNKIVAALRGVLREAWRLGLMDAETYRRATDLPTVRGEALQRGRALTTRQLQKLFAACAEDDSSAGRRDAALIAVLYGGGLRRSEAVALDCADYDTNTGELRIRTGRGRRGGPPTRPTAASRRSTRGWWPVGTTQGRCSGPRTVADGRW
jgi:integrase